MAEVASAYVTLIPSAKGFASGIQGQIGGQLNRAGMQGGKEFGTGMKSGVAGMASKVFLPLTVALGALGLGKLVADQLSGAVTAGSDFQQALGGAEAVFKKQADSVAKDAKFAAIALGLSKNAYLELATVTGASLKNKGIKDFAGETKNLIQVGADLAATFGGTTKDAVEALNSLLRGETDPIEKYGIAINQAGIEAEAVSLGLLKRVKDAGKIKAAQNTATLAQKKYNKAVKEHGKDSDEALAAESARFRAQAALKKSLEGQKIPLDNNAKATAALSLVQKQSADSTGAFARESDTYANKQQKLTASWENIKTSIGTALLPALTKLSSWFLSDGLPAIREFGNWLTQKLWPAIKRGWETVRPAFEDAKKIIMDAFGGESGKTLQDFGKFIIDKLVPAVARFVKFELPQVAAGIAAVIEVVQGLWKAFQFLMGVTRTVTTFLLSAFINVNRTVADMLEALSHVPGFGWAKGASDKLNGAADAAEDFKNQINALPDTVRIKFAIEVTGQQALAGVLAGVGAAALFKPKKRAKGGPVRAGSPYIVGEKGPELVVPRYNGNVIPNHQAGAALGASAGIDYHRLAGAVASEMRHLSLAVDTRQNVTESARYANSKVQL